MYNRSVGECRGPEGSHIPSVTLALNAHAFPKCTCTLHLRAHKHMDTRLRLRSVMSGAAVTRTTENKSAMAFEHSGMPSFAPGDSVLESQGADGLRTAKLSQNSDIGSGTPTKCRAQVLPAELSDSNMLSSVPGDSALESQGAGGLRTAKLSQFFGRRPRCSGRATSTGTEWPNPHLELPAVDSLSKWR